MELSWGPPGGMDAPVDREPIADAESLDARLDNLEEIGREAEPFVVELADPEAGTVGIVVGRDWSAATYERADGAPPYLLSAGDPELGPDPLAFFHSGHWTELPGEAAIPIADAREALRAFLRERRVPESVRWEET
jgi:hypothetical protein